MAAPIPVFALVHSSTLVTAGADLFIRFSDALTISFAGEGIIITFWFNDVYCRSGANDLKKIITLAKSVLIIIILSMGFAPLVFFFHLLTHALFKALLFLYAVAIIHGVGNTQDIPSRRAGG